MVDVDEHRRRIEAALARRALPAGQRLGARGQRIAHVPLGDGDLVVVDHRAEVVARTRAHLQLLDVAHDRVDELVVDRLEDIDPLDRDTRLTRVEHRTPHRGMRGELDVGVLEHDHRVLAAEFEADRGERAGGALHHLGAGRARPGELDEVGVVDDGLGHLAGALRERKHLRRTRVLPAAQQHLCGQRGALGRFEQHRAARGEGADGVHQGVGHGIVPRRDDADERGAAGNARSPS